MDPASASSNLPLVFWDGYGEEPWLNIDSNGQPFKYCLWFTWHIVMMFSDRHIPSQEIVKTWLAIVEGTNGMEDLWAWQDEDEEFLKNQFTRRFALNPSVHLLSAANWIDGCHAFDRRSSQGPPEPIFAQLTSEARVRLLGWFIAAGLAVRHNNLRYIDFLPLSALIETWAMSTLVDLVPGIHHCTICGVPQWLDPWITTMLEVYSVDHLASIPWRCTCVCLKSKLDAAKISVPKVLADQSLALRVLYGLVVSPWALILWVTFRKFNHMSGDAIRFFLDTIRREIFTIGDAPQEEWLFRRLRLYAENHTASNPWSLYPAAWQHHALELDPMMWQRISRITSVEQIFRRHDIEYETKLRLAGMFCTFASTTQTTINEILEPLGFKHDMQFFDTAARLFIPEPLRPDSLSLCDQRKRQAPSAPQLTLDRLECVHLAVKLPLDSLECVHLAFKLPFAQSFAIYVCSAILQLPADDSDTRNKFREAAETWMKCDTLTSLGNYPSVVEELFHIIGQSTPIPWHQVHKAAQTLFTHLSDDISTLLAKLMTMLNDSEAYKTFLSCRGTQAQRMLDLVQDLLDYDIPASRPSLFKALIRLSRASGLHPRCFPLTGVQKVGKQVAAGGFGDIWQGSVQGQHVSVKVMRIFRKDDVEVAMKDFGREALIWRQLSHPNLLPFFGLYYWEERLCLVSPWMENGNVLEFLRTTPASETERISLILDTSFGLEYLHHNHVVHGDLKAINILVTPSRRACIADFGLSSIADVMTLRFTHSTMIAKGGTTRWQAPELLSGEHPNHYGSDVYAFGCVCYEVLTGKAPFYEIQRDVAIIMKVIAGERPSRPISGSGADPLLMNSLWTLLQDCWAPNAENRPQATQIVQRLLGSPINARISKPSADWDESYTSKFRRSLRPMPFLPCIHDIERRLCGHDTAKACTECPLDRNLATQNADGSQRLGSTPDIPNHRKHAVSEEDGALPADKSTKKRRI
ncbi:hypothetical protein C8J57DRAFT_363158 [Mycena rebaudengoi]|nr:hypothetical protein C8J57DRAFT_363158 [Mycena rebaudengoi]